MASSSPAHKTVIISGASGLIGGALSASLEADGNTVRHLVRRPAANDTEISWDPARGIKPTVLADADVVINLNGASVGHLPWTEKYKKTLRSSRVLATSALASSLAALGADAPVFLSASASGFYGSQPGITLDETSSAGTTFLAQLCVDWENAALAASPHTRVVLLRTAPVVHPQGVLKPLMMLTKMGISGPLAGGKQAWPWISLEDEIRAIRHLIDHDVDGPANLTGPTRATANDLGFALAQRMHRPYLMPTPGWLLRTVLGRDASEGLMTSDADVQPKALTDSGFEFRYNTIEDAVAVAVPKK